MPAYSSSTTTGLSLGSHRYAVSQAGVPTVPVNAALHTSLFGAGTTSVNGSGVDPVPVPFTTHVGVQYGVLPANPMHTGALTGQSALLAHLCPSPAIVCGGGGASMGGS